MWDVRVPRDLRNWKDREESKGKGGEEAQGRVFASLSSTPPTPPSSPGEAEEFAGLRIPV